MNTEALERVEIREFLDFYMTHATELVEEVGYVPLPQKQYESNRELFEEGNPGLDGDRNNAGS